MGAWVHINRTKGRKGLTLIELMVVLIVISIGWLALMAVALQTLGVFEFFTALNLLSRWNEKIVNQVRDDAVAAKQYFGDDDRGRGYYADLEKPGDSYPIGTSRLPTIAETGSFGPDTFTDQKTGNALLFAKAVTPMTVTVPYTDAEDRTYRINVYRFVMYYLTIRPQERVGEFVGCLDLIRWSSVPVADYGQVMSIQDPDLLDSVDPRAAVVAAFVDAYNSTWLWDSGQDADEGFFACNSFGQVAALPQAPMTIPQDPTEGVRSTIPADITTNKHASICWNSSTPGFQAAAVVPIFAVESQLNDAFPHGFEVQVVGPSGARELLVRVAMAKGTPRGIVSREFSAVLTTREF